MDHGAYAYVLQEREGCRYSRYNKKQQKQTSKHAGTEPLLTVADVFG